MTVWDMNKIAEYEDRFKTCITLEQFQELAEDLIASQKEVAKHQAEMRAAYDRLLARCNVLLAERDGMKKILEAVQSENELIQRDLLHMMERVRDNESKVTELRAQLETKSSAEGQ